MPSKFVSIHGSYNCLDISLFSDQNLLETESKTGLRASSGLIPVIDSMLIKHKLRFDDLSFIAVDRGPGAFTSLRVTLATVNGMAFDKRIPLIGISGLEALVAQAVTENIGLIKDKTSIAVALLNAYNNDVYFLISKIGEKFFIIEQSSQKIEDLLKKIKNDFENHKIFFCGQGTQLHEKLIRESFGDQAIIPPIIQPFASSKIIGLMAYDYWIKKENIVDQVEPLYLKTQYFAVKK